MHAPKISDKTMLILHPHDGCPVLAIIAIQISGIVDTAPDPVGIVLYRLVCLALLFAVAVKAYLTL
jgi:hypothetical protein